MAPYTIPRGESHESSTSSHPIGDIFSVAPQIGHPWRSNPNKSPHPLAQSEYPPYVPPLNILRRKKSEDWLIIEEKKEEEKKEEEDEKLAVALMLQEGESEETGRVTIGAQELGVIENMEERKEIDMELICMFCGLQINNEGNYVLDKCSHIYHMKCLQTHLANIVNICLIYIYIYIIRLNLQKAKY